MSSERAPVDLKTHKQLLKDLAKVKNDAILILSSVGSIMSESERSSIIGNCHYAIFLEGQRNSKLVRECMANFVLKSRRWSEEYREKYSTYHISR